MDMVNLDASGQETGRTKIYGQADMIRMDDGDTSIVFLGNELLYIDHDDESYIVMDEAMLDKVSAQVNNAMKEMEAELAKMRPEERAMVEQLMKGRMQGMNRQQSAPTKGPRVESQGNGKWQSYACRKFAVYQGAEKTQDVCAAELDEIDGADEVMQAFRDMAAYMTKMTESLPMRSNQQMNPGELMDQIGGFPVHTIDYANGAIVGQSALDSVAEQDLAPDLFAAPEGYRREDPFSGR
jgi:hypothetical protein